STAEAGFVCKRSRKPPETRLRRKCARSRSWSWGPLYHKLYIPRRVQQQRVQWLQVTRKGRRERKPKDDMKEVLTKSFWQGVKKTFYEALEDPSPTHDASQAPAAGNSEVNSTSDAPPSSATSEQK